MKQHRNTGIDRANPIKKIIDAFSFFRKTEFVTDKCSNIWYTKSQWIVLKGKYDDIIYKRNVGSCYDG